MKIYTVNIDIFMCIHFRDFDKMGIFARIYIRDKVLFALCAMIKEILAGYILFSRILKKRELRGNMYNAKISTFTVCPKKT